MTTLNIYCDEIIRPNKHEFLILGALFIKENELHKALDYLEKSRCLNTSNHKWKYYSKMCPNKASCKEEWHKKNNTKIHFKEIPKHRERKIIAEKWLNLIKKDLKKHVNFNILVIDLNKLDCAYFGNNKTDLNIYNKFFRTLLKGGAKYFFKGKVVKINNIYHDEGSQKYHNYFPELNMQKLELESSNDLIIQNKKIIFVNDDHRKYLENDEVTELVKHSQFIQLIDIILGSFSQLFLNLSDKNDKKEIAENMREEFNNIFRTKWDYPYSVSLFPKYNLYELSKQFHIDKLNEGNLESRIATSLKVLGNFDNNCNLTMPKFMKNQLKLDEWM